MSMARVWREREKSEANKCKMYDGTYGSQLMVNGSWTNQAAEPSARFKTYKSSRIGEDKMI